ncbi:hypothetical protein [Ponticaulis profundi]|uniref:Uncharacterized protein n=1 Tax=Ponticaulis profundi TaxID=2665222 RepID=A0ABW1S870_9PROT
MKKSTYMDRALKARDPRFARVLQKLGYQRRDMVAEEPAGVSEPVAQPDDDLTELRSQYQKIVGKRAYHGWDADELKKMIAEASENGDE